MAESDSKAGRRLIKRHTGFVRVTHWINAICLGVLLMSGLQIFNAHPALYFGQKSTFDTPVFAIDSHEVGDNTQGYVSVLGHSVTTTGVLGVSNVNGEATERAFPSWATLPAQQDLGTGRKWHFLFAWILVFNGLAYMIYGLVTRHFKRDIVPDRADLAETGQSIRDHITFNFAKDGHAERYNVLQKLAYFGVIFVALPLIVLAGWTMSPGLDTAFPQLLSLFGGRQSARTIHFILAFGLLGFFVIHIVMVLLTGPINNLRSMTTGWFEVGAPKRKPSDA